MKNLCLFDLDGTLTDPVVGITKSLAYALDSFGIRVDDVNSLRKYIGPPLRDSFRELYNFSEEEVEKAVAKYREYYSEKGIFENALYDGVTEMLELLKSNGVRMVMATSKAAVFAEKIAAHFDIGQYFEFISGSELDGARSHKSEVIEYAFGNIPPAERSRSVMIGDRKHDIIGAKEAGLESIGVTWGYGSLIEFEEFKPTRHVNSPGEIFQTIQEMGTHP